MAENSGNKIWDWIKDHPWQTGVVVFVAGAAIIYLWSGGSTSTNASAASSGLSQSEIDSAMQLQAAQLQAQVQNNAIQASQGVQNTQTAASVSIATLQSQTQQNYDTLNAQTQQYIAGQQASVANTSTAASVTINQQNDAALEAVALAPYQLQEAELASINGSNLQNIQNAIMNLAQGEQALNASPSEGSNPDAYKLPDFIQSALQNSQNLGTSNVSGVASV